MDYAHLSRKKRILFWFVIVALFFLAAEFITDYFLNDLNQIGILEKRKTFAAYEGKPWAEQYFADLVACGRQTRKEKARQRFERYLMWDVGSNCDTESIQYSNRVRRTTNPDSREGDVSDDVYQIGMFGGSTMESLGVPDALTIPSLFSQAMNVATGTTAGARYVVTNYGASGYTFTQSVLKLLLLLREGKRFDYVVFYSGVNDVINAYAAGEAGALYDEGNIVTKLEGGFYAKAKAFLKEQIGSCSTCKLVFIVSRNTPVLKDAVAPIFVRIKGILGEKEAEKQNEEERADFARAIAQYYRDSHEFLDRLSAAYGFVYIEFWQPALYYDASPVGGESRLLVNDATIEDEKLRSVFTAVRDDLAAMRLEHYYDISGVLSDRTTPMYLDAVHVNDDANALVAKAMHRIFLETVK